MYKTKELKLKRPLALTLKPFIPQDRMFQAGQSMEQFKAVNATTC